MSSDYSDMSGKEFQTALFWICFWRGGRDEQVSFWPHIVRGLVAKYHIVEL